MNKDAVTELDVLWITAGLGCDGDAIAASKTSFPGQFPRFQKVNLRNFLALNNGDDFMKPFHQAAEGKISFSWS